MAGKSAASPKLPELPSKNIKRKRKHNEPEKQRKIYKTERKEKLMEINNFFLFAVV